MNNFEEIGLNNEIGNELISILEKMENVVDKAICQLEHLEAHGNLPV